MNVINAKVKSQKSCPVLPSKPGKLNATKSKRSTTMKYTTTTAAQRAKILEHLPLGKSLTTQQARVDMDIMHPGGRICELRKQGVNIKMVWVIIDTDKAKHRIGKYYLSNIEDGGNKND